MGVRVRFDPQGGHEERHACDVNSAGPKQIATRESFTFMRAPVGLPGRGNSHRVPSPLRDTCQARDVFIVRLELASECPQLTSLCTTSGMLRDGWAVLYTAARRVLGS
jgi:hypothetical protein